MPKLAALEPGYVPVVSYARISSDKAGDKHGVKDQHKINRRTAAKHGWTVVHEFTDNDKSAARADVFRDDFEAMLKALWVGELIDGTPVRGVVVWLEDRLVRRPGDYERFVDSITYNEGFVYADVDRILDLYNEDVEAAGLAAAVQAKKEVRKIQRRVRQSHRRRAEEGIPVGADRAFGWKDDKRTLNPIEAALIADGMDKRIAGQSRASIAAAWNRAGIFTPKGNPWKTNSVGYVLSNARICGWRELDGELVRDENGDPVVGKWERIVSPEKWLAVRAIDDARRGKLVDQKGNIVGNLPHDFRDPTHLLTGIVRCGKLKENGKACNKPLRVKSEPGGKTFRYACKPPAQGGCAGVARRGDLVDYFISELVLGKLEEAQFVLPEEKEWSGESELKETLEQIDTLTDRWMEKGVSNDRYFRILAKLEKEVKRLRLEKEKFTAGKERRQNKAAIDVADMRRRWYLPESDGGLALSLKRAHIREALHAVIILPSGGRGRTPFNPDLLVPIWRE
ncbi:recombinase family protein [Streptosporangium sp. H16]|uniref:recombinase family protein n=1 Tax=Streptosporangium sp. H16 TaxID=3444184 RepID=UPI003F795AC2